MQAGLSKLKKEKEAADRRIAEQDAKLNAADVEVRFFPPELLPRLAPHSGPKRLKSSFFCEKRAHMRISQLRSEDSFLGWNRLRRTNEGSVEENPQTAVARI